MKLAKLITITLFSAFPFTALAEENGNTLNAAGIWSFDASVELINLDAEQARQEGIETRAPAIGLYGNYIKRAWITTIGISMFLYSDNEEFSQTVRNTGTFNNGRLETVSSDASGMALGIATGRQWLFGKELNNSGILQLGYDYVVTSERSISSCTDCYSEDINIDGGAYVRGIIKRNFSGFSAGLTVSHYISGDGLSNRFGITFGSVF